MEQQNCLLEFLSDYANWYLSDSLCRIKPHSRFLVAENTIIYQVSSSPSSSIELRKAFFQNILSSLSMEAGIIFSLQKRENNQSFYYYGLAADLGCSQTGSQEKQELVKNSQIFERSYQIYFPDSTLTRLAPEETAALIKQFGEYSYSAYLEGTPGTADPAAIELALQQSAKIQNSMILVLAKPLSQSCMNGLICYLNQVIDQVSALQSITKSQQCSRRNTCTNTNTFNCLASNSNTFTNTSQTQQVFISNPPDAQGADQEADEEILSEDIFRNPAELLDVDEEGNQTGRALPDSQADRRSRMESGTDSARVWERMKHTADVNDRRERCESMHDQGSRKGILSGCAISERDINRYPNVQNTYLEREQTIPLAINNAETGIGEKTNAAVNSRQAHANYNLVDRNVYPVLNSGRPFTQPVAAELDSQSLSESDAQSNAKVKLSSVNDSVSKAKTEEEIHSTTTSQVFTNTEAQDWVTYLKQTVKQELSQAAGHGLYLFTNVFFTKENVTLSWLGTLFRNVWLDGSQFVPLKVTPLSAFDERRKEFTQFQIPLYLLNDGECFSLKERTERTAFSQLLLNHTAYCCNFTSGDNISLMLQLPTAESVQLKQRG